MILLAAIAFGTVIGWLGAWRANINWHPPALKFGWLVVAGFLPQFFAIYLPTTRSLFSDMLASATLIISQIVLLVFCLINRQIPGMVFITVGLASNLIAILANGGFMPLPVETAAHLLPFQPFNQLVIGQRLGAGSKDILLPMSQIRFSWLADRFYPPEGLPYRFAFSLGDMFIAAGAFWFLAKPGLANKPV
jgi:uncharacterized protein DUF5317